MRFAFRGGRNPVGDRISARSRLGNELLPLTLGNAFPSECLKMGLATGRVLNIKKSGNFSFFALDFNAFLLFRGRIFLLESGGLPMTCGWHTVAGHPWGSARTA
jgi:hypothetical protein